MKRHECRPPAYITRDGREVVGECPECVRAEDLRIELIREEAEQRRVESIRDREDSWT